MLEASADLTITKMSYKMSCMRKMTISMRELQRNLKGVMTRVEHGQVIEVTTAAATGRAVGSYAACGSRLPLA